MRVTCAYVAKGRHKRAPVRKPRSGEKFEGSRRQARGSIVDHLRRAARKGITLGDLAKQLDGGADTSRLVEVLAALERDGLAELTPAARRGSPRGIVRLPMKTRPR